MSTEFSFVHAGYLLVGAGMQHIIYSGIIKQSPAQPPPATTVIPFDSQVFNASFHDITLPWTGLCTPASCQKGGLCYEIPTRKTFGCVCPMTFSGRTCEIDPPPPAVVVPANEIKTFALILVLMRAGLGLKLSDIRKSGLSTAALFTLPYLCEVHQQTFVISASFYLGWFCSLWSSCSPLSGCWAGPRSTPRSCQSLELSRAIVLSRTCYRGFAAVALRSLFLHVP